MIEATDDDYDDTDDLPDIPHMSSSPPLENNGTRNISALLPNPSVLSDVDRQQGTHITGQRQHESLTCGICNFKTTSFDEMIHHNQLKHPDIVNNDSEQTAQRRNRKGRKSSDNKRRTLSPEEKSAEKHQRNGCETNSELHTTLDIKPTDLTTNTCTGVSPPSSIPGRPGAPHYCEICGKVWF